MKILSTTPIPTQDLFALRNQLSVLGDQVEKLLQYSFVEEPKPEVTPVKKVEPSPNPKNEASSDEEIMPGVFIKKPPAKPFEMVIE